MLKIIKDLLFGALFSIRSDMKKYLESCLANNISSVERKIVELYLVNQEHARVFKTPMCQDTGLVTIFLASDVARNLNLPLLKTQLMDYMKDLNMRNSQIKSPLEHINLGENQIPFIKIIDRWQGKVGVQVSGAGSELQGFMLTFNGSASEEDIRDRLVSEILIRFPKSCPPVTIGIGMGGTMADAVMLSKLALFRKIGELNESHKVALLENDVLSSLWERSNRGAQGIIEGKCGIAHVAIETEISHIAGFHTVVSFQCYLTRSWSTNV